MEDTFVDGVPLSVYLDRQKGKEIIQHHSLITNKNECYIYRKPIRNRKKYQVRKKPGNFKIYSNKEIRRYTMEGRVITDMAERKEIPKQILIINILKNWDTFRSIPEFVNGTSTSQKKRYGEHPSSKAILKVLKDYCDIESSTTIISSYVMRIFEKLIALGMAEKRKVGASYIILLEDDFYSIPIDILYRLFNAREPEKDPNILNLPPVELVTLREEERRSWEENAFHRLVNEYILGTKIKSKPSIPDKSKEEEMEEEEEETSLSNMISNLMEKAKDPRSGVREIIIEESSIRVRY